LLSNRLGFTKGGKTKYKIRGETGRCSQGLSGGKPSSKVVVAIQVDIKSKEQTLVRRVYLYILVWGAHGQVHGPCLYLFDNRTRLQIV